MSALDLGYLFRKLSLQNSETDRNDQIGKSSITKAVQRKEEEKKGPTICESPPPLISEWNPPVAELYNIQLRKPYLLYPYQLQIVKWLEYRELTRFEGISGGLLNVFMGAGKGVIILCRVVSDIVHKRQEDKKVGPTLIVVPKSLVPTIQGECAKFFGSQLRALVYFKEYLADKSTFESIKAAQFYQYHVVITTYDVIVGAAKKISKTNIQSSDIISQGPLLLMRIPWYRIIVDVSSQTFNNPKGTVFQSLLRVQSDHRIALSGTPIRNYEKDMYVQLKFLGMNTIKNPREWSEKIFIEHKFKEVIFTLEGKDVDLKLPLLTEIEVECVLHEEATSTLRQNFRF